MQQQTAFKSVHVMTAAVIKCQVVRCTGLSIVAAADVVL
jgi:hypothetical protein